jgi:Mitochondrial carrier protein
MWREAQAGSAWGGRPRELESWQYIAIGGAAGALASLATMPADVLKTRIMTAAAGSATPNAGGIVVPPLGACTSSASRMVCRHFWQRPRRQPLRFMLSQSTR